MYKDGEVVGIDADNCLILWDANKKRRYNCGETLAQFGIENLSKAEIAIIDKHSILNMLRLGADIPPHRIENGSGFYMCEGCGENHVRDIKETKNRHTGAKEWNFISDKWFVKTDCCGRQMCCDSGEDACSVSWPITIIKEEKLIALIKNKKLLESNKDEDEAILCWDCIKKATGEIPASLK